MKLIIDGTEVTAMPGESLYDIAKRLGMYKGSLKTDPIAAKLSGEVFTLNYIPKREGCRGDVRESMRKAMAASGGVVRMLRYTDPTGKDAYTRTAQFVIFLAMSRKYPGACTKMSCSVGAALYFTVSGCENFSAEELAREVDAIVREDIPLQRRRISTAEAIEYYKNRGDDDKARLFSFRESPTLDVYTVGDFSDYYYGEMAPTTAHLRAFEIVEADGGFMFIYPDSRDPDRPSKRPELPKLLSVYRDGKRWGELMECETVADLNDLVRDGKIRELIRVNEALHEKRYSQVADAVCERGSRAVLLAGPSSSGKTTSANRLATQLRVHGKKPILMSLDDYYLDRDKIPTGPDGKVDLEHINTIDTQLFREHLTALLHGERVEIPTFNFTRGKREWVGHVMELDERSVIIIEGLHALNPTLLPENLDTSLIFRLYVTPLLPLNLDDHNRIGASYLRLLRRTVRDYKTRNSSVQKTFSMWDSVRRGEERWIFPYQENADMIFNSSTLYELAVLKKYIYPLLLAIEPEEECYDEVRAIVKILNFVHTADVDDEIPPTSLVREFIGGNSFYR